MGKLRGKLSFANVVSVISLVFALGLGGAYAATELDKNEVKSKHLKNGGVKTKDLANDAVNSPKVANGSLLGEDFAAGQLPQGPQGEQGPQGLQGEPGRQGETGPPGPTYGATSSIRALAPATPDLLNQSADLDVTLPAAGKLYLSGDFQRDGGPGVQVDCVPTSGVTVALYVDGNPVPGTTRILADDVGEAYHASGVTDGLSAGSHRIQLGVTCAGASVDSVTLSADNSISAILLGS